MSDCVNADTLYRALAAVEAEIAAAPSGETASNVLARAEAAAACAKARERMASAGIEAKAIADYVAIVRELVELTRPLLLKAVEQGLKQMAALESGEAPAAIATAGLPVAPVAPSSAGGQVVQLFPSGGERHFKPAAGDMVRRGIVEVCVNLPHVVGCTRWVMKTAEDAATPPVSGDLVIRAGEVVARAVPDVVDGWRGASWVPVQPVPAEASSPTAAS